MTALIKIIAFIFHCARIVFVFAHHFLPVLLVVAFYALIGIFNIVSPRLFLFFFLICLLAAFFFSFQRKNVGSYSMDKSLSLLEGFLSLPHAPLRTLKDKPATRGDFFHDKKWRNHKQNALLALKKSRLAIGKNDISSLRGFFYGLAAFVLFLWIVPQEGLGRLLQNVSIAPLPLDAHLRIVPPSYTHQLPFAVDAHAKKILFPEGSVLQVTSKASWQKPRLTVHTHSHRQTVALTGTKNLGYDGTTTLKEDSRALTLFHEGRDIHIPLVAIKDKEPVAYLTATKQEGYITPLPYAALDDYGIHSSVLKFNHATGMRDDITLLRSLNNKKDYGKSIHGTLRKDLTAHPFAGEDIILTLKVQDGYPHDVTSENITLRLPERVFYDEHAQAIIALRKAMMLPPHPSIGNHLLSLLPFISDNTQASQLVKEASGETHRQKTAELLWRAALILDGQRQSAALAKLKELFNQWEKSQDPQDLEQLKEQLKNMQKDFAEKDALKNMEQQLSSNHPEQMRSLLDQLEQQQAMRDYQNARRKQNERAQDILKKQKKLMEDTQQQQNGYNSLHKRQEQLKEQLEQLPFLEEDEQNALNAMKDAEQFLKEQKQNQAIDKQEDAISSLLKGLGKNERSAQNDENTGDNPLKGLGKKSSQERQSDISLLQKNEQNEQKRILNQLRSKLEDEQTSTQGRLYFKNLLPLF